MIQSWIPSLKQQVIPMGLYWAYLLLGWLPDEMWEINSFLITVCHHLLLLLYWIRTPWPGSVIRWVLNWLCWMDWLLICFWRLPVDPVWGWPITAQKDNTQFRSIVISFIPLKDYTMNSGIIMMIQFRDKVGIRWVWAEYKVNITWV